MCFTHGWRKSDTLFLVHFPPVQCVIIPTVTAHLLLKARMFVQPKADPEDETAAVYEKKLRSQSHSMPGTHDAELQ